MPPSNPMGLSSDYGGEPPCRQRRLEPWRHQIRKMCSIEAYDNCSPEAMKVERSQPDQFDDLDSLLNAMFGSPPQPQKVQKEEDPFESLFSNMLELSIREFDKIMSQSTFVGVSSQTVDEAEVENEEAGEKEGGEGAVNSGSEDFMLAAVQAAENSLDTMVASLAQSVQQEKIDTSKVNSEDSGDGAIRPSVINLPQLLLQLGKDLLSETHSDRRRLLEEGGEKMDVHSHVKERLARRLTEYRTDLFFDSDGTITMYTTSEVAPSSLFSPAPISLDRHLQSWEVETPLGMGSTHFDQCMRSRFDNGDLGGECHGAVKQLLLAVGDRSLMPPSSAEEEYRRTAQEVNADFNAWLIAAPQGASDPRTVHALPTLMYSSIFLICVFLMDRFMFSNDEEDDEEEEDEVGDGYTRMSEDDNTDGHPATREGTRVFVGIPVQVV